MSAERLETTGTLGETPDVPVANLRLATGKPEFGDSADLSLSIVDAAGFASHMSEWLCLSRRAAVPNVFMDPAMALAVEAASGHPVRILLVWHDATTIRPDRFLVGAWLGISRPTRSSWPFQGFCSPTTSIAYLGTPVIDAAFAEMTFLYLLQGVRNETTLPDFIEVGDFSVSLLPPLTAALMKTNMPWRVIGRRRRARLFPNDDPISFWAGTSSKAHAKNLARQRRRLTEMGSLTITATVCADQITSELEEFMAIEAAGWKGARASALISDVATVTTVRAMIRGLAARGQVKIHALRLDGRPLAMSILLYSGQEAFTWRIAYDESFRKFSPGIQLMEAVTFDLLGDRSVRLTDSCNAGDTGFQAERWPERHELVDLLIGVRGGLSIPVGLFAGRERAFRQAKQAARCLRHMARNRIAARKKSKDG